MQVFALACLLGQACGARATELAKLIPDNPVDEGWFGISAAMQGGTALVGANPLTQTFNRFGPGSVYVFEEDGNGQWSQSAQLFPSGSHAGDRFGGSVALSGDYAVVGAATGTGAADRTGSAYVFERSATGEWVEVAQLFSPTPFERDSFGTSVDIDGDTIVVGAGGDTAPLGEQGGRAYLYQRDSLGDWNQIATLQASDPETSNGFGYPSIGISGGRVIVGAYLEDNVAHEAGAAYIFEEDANGEWPETAKLIASDAADLNWFGWSVDLSDDIAVVGSVQGGDYGDRSGSVYVFERDSAGMWVEETKLRPSIDPVGAGLGHDVAVSGELIVAGALTDDQGQFTGSAFAFRKSDTGEWRQAERLVASDAAAGDHYGNALSIYGDNVLIGAWVDDYAGHTDSGSVYLHRVRVPEPASAVGFAIVAVFGLARRGRGAAPATKYSGA